MLTPAGVASRQRWGHLDFGAFVDQLLPLPILAVQQGEACLSLQLKLQALLHRSLPVLFLLHTSRPEVPGLYQNHFQVPTLCGIDLGVQVGPVVQGKGALLLELLQLFHLLGNVHAGSLPQHCDEVVHVRLVPCIQGKRPLVLAVCWVGIHWQRSCYDAVASPVSTEHLHVIHGSINQTRVVIVSHLVRVDVDDFIRCGDGSIVDIEARRLYTAQATDRQPFQQDAPPNPLPDIPSTDRRVANGGIRDVRVIADDGSTKDPEGLVGGRLPHLHEVRSQLEITGLVRVHSQHRGGDGADNVRQHLDDLRLILFISVWHRFDRIDF
mmetsp:Transcript_2841/g.6436  ORF Transcript_2841/g.6436 Transcript_2841/m.6436 type:complete len:324 (+) Transcript_2841:1668-2639(+)